jgi:hypothetical protein
MRRFLRPLLVSILLLEGSPAHAQEQSPTWQTYDFGLAPGVGYFLYPQYVDGGYAINGVSQNLVWSGLQLQLSGDLHWRFANHPFLALGVAAAFLVAPNATGEDRDHTVSMDPDQSALGGTLAFSACFRPSERWRLMVQTGLGRNGMSGALGFGGTGLLFGVAAHRMLGVGAFATGVGLRLNAMALFASRDGNVRGESGLYASLLFEVLLESRGRYEVVDRPPDPRTDQPW